MIISSGTLLSLTKIYMKLILQEISLSNTLKKNYKLYYLKFDKAFLNKLILDKIYKKNIALSSLLKLNLPKLLIVSFSTSKRHILFISL